MAVFTIPKGFEPFPKLASLSYRIVTGKAAWPPDAWLRLLILSKSALPGWT